MVFRPSNVIFLFQVVQGSRHTLLHGHEFATLNKVHETLNKVNETLSKVHTTLDKVYLTHSKVHMTLNNVHITLMTLTTLKCDI